MSHSTNFLIQVAKKENYLEDCLSVRDGRLLLYYAYTYQNVEILDELSSSLMIMPFGFGRCGLKSTEECQIFEVVLKNTMPFGRCGLDSTEKFFQMFGVVLKNNHCFWKYIYPHLPDSLLVYLTPKLLKKILKLRKVDYEIVKTKISYKDLIKYYPEKRLNFVKNVENHEKLVGVSEIDIFDDSVIARSFWGDRYINKKILEARSFYQNQEKRKKWILFREREKYLTKIQYVLIKTLKILRQNEISEIVEQVFSIMLDFYRSQKNRIRTLKKKLHL